MGQMGSFSGGEQSRCKGCEVGELGLFKEPSEEQGGGDGLQECGSRGVLRSSGVVSTSPAYSRSEFYLSVK